MRTLKILNNDLILSDRTLTMVEDVDALAEVISARLKLWKGEWFAAPDSGIDYFNLFQNKQLLQQKARKVYKDAITADARILRLNDLELTYDNATRTMTGEFNAETTEGLLEATI
jgi:hypothetical protein